MIWLVDTVVRAHDLPLVVLNTSVAAFAGEVKAQKYAPHCDEYRQNVESCGARVGINGNDSEVYQGQNRSTSIDPRIALRE